MSRTTAILYSDLGRPASGKIVHRFGGFGGFDEARCGKKPKGSWDFGINPAPKDPANFCKHCFPQDFVLLEGERISRP